jgi:uncharacterized protein YutE (UPF0331/DUF86 family)
LAKLKAFQTVNEDEYVREPAVHHLAERYLHLALEACLDLTNHWIADQQLGAPDTNRDSFTVLERSGELDADLAERMRGWASLRNILVHEYLAIDHALVYRAIREELDDLEGLIRWAVSKLAG